MFFKKKPFLVNQKDVCSLQTDSILGEGGEQSRLFKILTDFRSIWNGAKLI